MSHPTYRCLPVVVLVLLSMVACKDNFPDRDSGTPDADADIDGDGDSDGDADADGDGDGDADADGDEESDADDQPCDVAPSGVDPATVVGVGCPWVGDPGLTDLIVNEVCQISTDSCSFDCPIFARSCEAPMLDGHAACVIAASSVEIGPDASIVVIGTRPLIILATGPIVVRGQILANAQNQSPGPSGGAGSWGDEPGEGPGGGESTEERHEPPNSSAGGGGGAGHAAEGGLGGCDLGGIGGSLYGDCAEPFLRGGSGGGSGGTDWIGMGGLGGGGGGAVHLFSLESVLIETSGVVDVSGSAGGQGYDDGYMYFGGGGGGSGGSVLLESPTVTIDGSATASGGIGGSVRSGDISIEGGVGGGSEAVGGGDGLCEIGPDEASASGGGGAAGRIYIRTVAGALLGNGVVVPALAGCISHTFPACD